MVCVCGLGGGGGALADRLKATDSFVTQCAQRNSRWVRQCVCLHASNFWIDSNLAIIRVREINHSEQKNV
jgi:hypothetical protein